MKIMIAIVLVVVFAPPVFALGAICGILALCWSNRRGRR